MKNFQATKLTLLSLLISVLSFSSEVSALEYNLHPGNKSRNLTAILATGPIEMGDTVKLKLFLGNLSKRKHTAIYLASPGGNLYEGIKLGVFFTQHRIKTIIDGGRDCASACALAFLGGRDRFGNIWRSSSSNSRIGFHAFSSVGGDEISTDGTQKIVSDILKYGKIVNAPIELLIVSFSTPSNQIQWITNRQICKLGIKLWDVEANQFSCNK